ncbi:MAG TPA: type II toxin-antitoxin system RelE/ParE family toxin [Terriglobia bacterium]|nr:type II toxin-antitoxin system RelE/ParE family toxin [Terriglobia bacterium]
MNRAIQRILQYPEAWSPLSARTRRCRTNKFPYGVIYQIRGDTVLIVAVMHLHRKPGTWKNRLRGH